MDALALSCVEVQVSIYLLYVSICVPVCVRVHALVHRRRSEETFLGWAFSTTCVLEIKLRLSDFSVPKGTLQKVPLTSEPPCLLEIIFH